VQAGCFRGLLHTILARSLTWGTRPSPSRSWRFVVNLSLCDLSVQWPLSISDGTLRA